MNPVEIPNIDKSATADPRVIRRGLRKVTVLTAEETVNEHEGKVATVKRNADDRDDAFTIHGTRSTLISSPPKNGEAADCYAGVSVKVDSVVKSDVSSQPWEAHEETPVGRYRRLLGIPCPGIGKAGCDRRS